MGRLMGDGRFGLGGYPEKDLVKEARERDRGKERGESKAKTETKNKFMRGELFLELRIAPLPRDCQGSDRWIVSSGTL